MNPICAPFRVLPGSTVRQLTDEELAVYRAPFPTPESRRPTLRLPNELPIAGEPADVDAALRQAHAVLRASGYPSFSLLATPARSSRPLSPSSSPPSCTTAAS
jgi:haloalkane dehalogenase